MISQNPNNRFPQNLNHVSPPPCLSYVELFRNIFCKFYDSHSPFDPNYIHYIKTQKYRHAHRPTHIDTHTRHTDTKHAHRQTHTHIHRQSNSQGIYQATVRRTRLTPTLRHTRHMMTVRHTYTDSQIHTDSWQTDTHTNVYTHIYTLPPDDRSIKYMAEPKTTLT